MSTSDKIKQVLTIKNLSPSYLADDIGVQRSSISHILSGRNRPSLDIIQKIVRRFPEFTYEWFLDTDIQLSTDDNSLQPTQPNPVSRNQPNSITKQRVNDKDASIVSGDTGNTILRKNSAVSQNEPIIPKSETTIKPTVERILIFYTDGTFREYTPAYTAQG